MNNINIKTYNFILRDVTSKMGGNLDVSTKAKVMAQWRSLPFPENAITKTPEQDISGRTAHIDKFPSQAPVSEQKMSATQLLAKNDCIEKIKLLLEDYDEGDPDSYKCFKETYPPETVSKVERIFYLASQLPLKEIDLDRALNLEKTLETCQNAISASSMLNAEWKEEVMHGMREPDFIKLVDNFPM